MNAALRKDVIRRANDCCEYCGFPQDYTEITQEIDHIIARKHNGPTTMVNLSLACFKCNNAKDPGVDDGTVVRLYHPRVDVWEEHFRWHGGELVGLTAIGRVTIHTLDINEPYRVQHRAELMEEGVYPLVPGRVG